MTKENETYTLEIKSSLLSQAGYIYMQLRITQDENVNGIPVFKSKKFYVEVLNAINATATIEDDYPSIIDIVNTKQDKLIVGENITIKDNVISATSGGGASNIDDVQVDGVSVVKDGIANIELSGLETVLQNILKAIQNGGTTSTTIAEIEQLIVSYFENKTVGEVEE